MSFDKLYKKYAIMPPPPNGELEVIIPKVDKLPEIKEISEQEMKDWEEFVAEQKLKKDLERTKEIVDLGLEEKAPVEERTIPAIPGKKANLSPDTLLKMCSQYHDLCRKF